MKPLDRKILPNKNVEMEDLSQVRQELHNRLVDEFLLFLDVCKKSIEADGITAKIRNLDQSKKGVKVPGR